MVVSEVDIAKADPAAASHPLLLNGDATVAQKNPGSVAENNLCSQYEEKVRPCIDLIDSLRALGVEQDLALPAIAVIGDQSSGKSSVLEALSGVALPRGSGIVTRCPLVLKLKKLVNEDKWRGKVSYQDYEIEISDASEVEKEINKAQNAIAGEGMGISHELITLEISSRDVPDLTLIDLPGITRVAVGNQPADIGYKIKTLIKKYIQRQETISLVVVPSNVDIATTEALSMAQEVDPEGDRTIGILTKPDLVDKGTEDKVVDVVRNLVFHLKKGYMIVKCRGQQEIQDQLSLSEALQREKIFFENHPYFRDLLEEGKATVPCLAEKLTSELITHICKSLPLLENQIKETHQRITEELQKYGVDIPEDENEKMFFLIDKVNAFNQDITALMQGEETVGEEDIRLFTRLRHEFHKWSTIIENNFQEGHKILSRKIQKFENQYRGRELPGFVNYRTFETIVKQQIKALEEPAVDMLHTVTDMVRLAFTDVSIKNFEEFFNLHRTAKSKIEDIRAEQEREGEKLIRLHFQMEQIVYCQDQVYRGALQKVREKELEEEKKKKSWDFGAFQSSSATDSSMEEIFQHLMAYHQEASKRISSHIPLIIQFFMLQTYGQQLQKAMLQLLQDKDTYSWLLKERSDTSDKRKFLKERLARLTQARRRLAQFPG
ncbi:interferon-induced GTP-binding protein Mx1 isoform a [Homo sapiens]|uniref:Interferon-induced GTP-binding protein Mx1 n=4 Tax=Homo sapiens TaxID=9606 RepID=MX1_HUMAN|nr:interferon-induced GTP-binding protein Mx1 isoform a [Homo sapiens]NP_001171517.1 interferon-induced GTP-binding protein Mx1 isoform a [Homo sapiens]NP_002453.2 interferon-induced GTP-binding protein Mx1 isoform a [Homo sapiens]XP_005261035.1 interferon-induced GTP-binding protein Mx1 isoform X1 [Homo sapiens]XP_005261037.1 interferon-induced GTP-binding protein Mx1 isoform X1 [Homo sapiens]XP_005261038.1 interferon-induced GTP-binding protein Mx1 isoform X1 [Homo sapiens]XP_005261039.1 in|eukprot:NP_001138397.1 interferon-induced GTP-binding protein Mx1 isoform a [Homo sapiens]